MSLWKLISAKPEDLVDRLREGSRKLVRESSQTLLETSPIEICALMARCMPLNEVDVSGACLVSPNIIEFYVDFGDSGASWLVDLRTADHVAY